MATFDERQKEYDQTQVPEAWRAHVAEGIRKKFANEFDFGNLSPQEVIQRHYSRFGAAMSPQEYKDKLDEVYGKGFTPPPAPTKTLGDRAGDVVEGAKSVAEGLVPFVIPEVGKAAVGKAGAAVATKAIPGVSQIGFLGGHAINEAVDVQAARALEKTAAALPRPVDRTQEFYDKLHDGLAARGYTDEQIMQEARGRSQNIERGYQQTTESIGQDVEAAQARALTEPARAASDAFFLGVGAPAIEGLLQKGLVRVGLMKTGAAVAAKPVTNMIGNVASHIKTGVIIGAPGMGIQGAITAGVQAAADNKTPQEISQALVKGGMKGVKEGALGGAIIGGAAGTLEAGLGAVAAPFVRRARKLEFRESRAQAELDEARLRGWRDFNAGQRALVAQGEKERIASIGKTADNFDPHTSTVPLEGDPAEIATTLIQQQHGDDAALSEAGLRAASKIEERIRLHQDAESALNPTVSLPGEKGTSVVPPGASLEPQPGISPEVAPAAVQGPIGERAAPFTPPPAVEALPGLETRPAAPQQALSEGDVTPLGPSPEEAQARKTALDAALSQVAPKPATSAPDRQAAIENALAQVPQKSAAQAAPAPAPPAGESLAARAIKTMNVGEHATLSEGAGGREVNLEKLGGTGPGRAAAALDEVIRQADKHQVPVVTRITQIPGPRGGTIPIEKMLPWYEKHGFTLTESTKLPEGQLATATLRREPVGEHQQIVGNALTRAAAAAKKRIAQRVSGERTGEVGAVGDLSSKPPQDWVGQDFLDHSLVLASDMFTRGLRTKAAVEQHLMDLYGDGIKPVMSKLIDMARKHFIRMFRTPQRAEKNLQTLLALGESGRQGANWYEKTADWAKQNFGKDSDMMLRFLAITSANGQTESGAAMALKAFAQWKSGMPFEGFRGESMVGQLEKIVEGKNLGEHTKIQNFYDALKGDPNAVVLDRWMINALGLKEKGGALRENDYRVYANVLRDLAQMNDMTPRQFQAAVWAGARIRKAHMSERSVGRALTTKSGSAYPLEDLVDRKLGGMSIDQYVAANKGDLTGMEKLYQGLEPVRKGENSGHTFNIDTYEPDTQKGYVVSIASTMVPKKVLYPGEVLKFKEQVGSIIDEVNRSNVRSEEPKHLTIGVFSSEAHPGQFSIDLNVTVPSRDEALRIGKMNRQEAVANLGEGGKWIENIPTGYSEKKHGKQFILPTNPAQRTAWLKQNAPRIRALLAPATSVKEIMRDKIGEVAKEVSPSGTFSGGRKSGEPVWMTPDGKLFVGKSHEDVALPVAKAAGLSEKKSGYKGLYRWENHALLQNGFIRIQMFPERMVAEVVGNPSLSQRGQIARMAKGRNFESVLVGREGNKNFGMYHTPIQLFRAAEKESQ